MNSGTQIELVLTVVASIGWIAIGVSLLRRGAGRTVVRQSAVPSFFRRAIIATCWLLFVVAWECLLHLQGSLTPARLVDFLLLRDLSAEVAGPLHGIGLWYVLYLLVLIAPSFLPSDLDAADRFTEPLLPGKPVDVSAEWKHRCDKFRSRNRRWLLAAIAWLAAAGAVAICGFLGILSDDAYLYAGLLLLAGIVVFLLPAVTLPMLLVCPNCACTPRRRSFNLYRWLDEIQECESCHAKLG